MKSLGMIAGLGLVCVLVGGCCSVEVVAPYGQEVYLIPADEHTEIQREWRTWYVGWGIGALDKTMPAEIIQRERLNEVRVIVKDNPRDAIYGFLYNVVMPIGLVNQSIVVEGNHVPSRVEAPASP